jgi:hypothetical protein
MPLLYQLGGIFFIKPLGLSFALPVRAISSRKLRALVGLQSTPFQGVQDVFLCSGNIAALIRVFDTEDKVTAMPAGE